MWSLPPTHGLKLYELCFTLRLFLCGCIDQFIPTANAGVMLLILGEFHHLCHLKSAGCQFDFLCHMNDFDCFE